MEGSRLPKLLGELRRRLGLTQAKLAALLKVSVPTIARWESGKTAPDVLGLDAIEKFVKRLGPKHRDLYDRFFGTASGAWFAEPAIETAGQRRAAGRRSREDSQAVVPGRPKAGPLETKE